MAPPEEKAVMQVIGAGLPRTGTSSLQIALEKLLGGSCYHMKELVFKGDGKHVEMFLKAKRGEASAGEWKEFFEAGGYTACVDYPTSFFYEELATAFPKAKVVLTVRDPVGWGASVRNTVLKGFLNGQTFPTNLLLALTGGRGKHKVCTCLKPDVASVMHDLAKIYSYIRTGRG